MKKYLKWIVLLVVLIICEVFMIDQRATIKEMERDSNEIYLEYESNKSQFTVTSGPITKVIPPRSERSIEEDHAIFSGGTFTWLCYIEFKTEDGKTVTNRFFSYDTENDFIGKRWMLHTI